MAIVSWNKTMPRQLVSAEVAIGNANFVQITNTTAVLWRFETVLVTDYDQVAFTTSANMKLYKPVNAPHGYGRVVRGLLLCRDSEAIEALVQNSHLNANLAGSAPSVSADLRLRCKFNTGNSTDNFRYVTKYFQPVIFGVGYSTSDWIQTIEKADEGERMPFVLPWQLAINTYNTNFNASNINAAGVYSVWSNT